MPLTHPVAIVVNVQPVGPWKTLAEQILAIHVSAAYDVPADVDLVTDRWRRDLLPWNWRFDGWQGRGWTLQGDAGLFLDLELETIGTERYPAPLPGVVSKLRRWVDVESPDELRLRPGEDGHRGSVAQSVEHLATLPGACAQRLGVAHYVRVTRARISEGQGPPPSDVPLADLRSLVVAPEVTLDTVEGPRSFRPRAGFRFLDPVLKTDENGDPIFEEIDGRVWQRGWPYLTDASDLERIRAYVQPLEVESRGAGANYGGRDAEGPHLRFDKYWVLPFKAAPWGDLLPESVVQLLDLGARTAEVESLHPYRPKDEESPIVDAVELAWQRRRIQCAFTWAQWRAVNMVDPDSMSDPGSRRRFEAVYQRFRELFPDASEIILVLELRLRVFLAHLGAGQEPTTPLEIEARWLRMLAWAWGREPDGFSWDEAIRLYDRREPLAALSFLPTLPEWEGRVLSRSLHDHLHWIQWHYAVHAQELGSDPQVERLRHAWDESFQTKPALLLEFASWPREVAAPKIETLVEQAVLATRGAMSSEEVLHALGQALSDPLTVATSDWFEPTFLPRLPRADDKGSDHAAEAEVDQELGSFYADLALRTADELLEADVLRSARTRPRPRKKPGGLTLQLDDPRAEQDRGTHPLDHEDPKPDDDAWSTLAGVGLLARKKPTETDPQNASADWRLVSSADLTEGGVDVLAAAPESVDSVELRVWVSPRVRPGARNLALFILEPSSSHPVRLDGIDLLRILPHDPDLFVATFGAGSAVDSAVASASSPSRFGPAAAEEASLDEERRLDAFVEGEEAPEHVAWISTDGADRFELEILDVRSPVDGVWSLVLRVPEGVPAGAYDVEVNGVLVLGEPAGGGAVRWNQGLTQIARVRRVDGGLGGTLDGIGDGSPYLRPGEGSGDLSGVRLRLDLISPIPEGSRVFGRVGQLYEDALPAPVRLGFRYAAALGERAIRVPQVTYDQRPLVAQSGLGDALAPWYRISDESGDPASPADVAAYRWRAVLGRRNLTESALDGLRLLPLRWGNWYELAAFPMDEAGGLPTELTAGVPWRFDPDWSAAVDEEAICEFHYLRRVPVGEVRIWPVMPDGTPADWPGIPEGVHPIARELAGHNLRKLDGELEPPEVAEEPLALLHDLGSLRPVVDLHAQAPSVELDTLERWLPLRSGDDRRHLARVHAEYLELISERDRRAALADAPDSGPADPIYMADPAVSSLGLVVERWDWQTSKWDSRMWLRVAVPDPTTADGLGRHQPPPLRVRVMKGGGYAITDLGGGEVVVQVAEQSGEVSRLSVHALVSQTLLSGNEQRFEDRFYEDSDSELFPGYVALAPIRSLYEQPGLELPTPAELWQALEVRVVGDGGSVEVSLEPRAGAPLPPWRELRWRNVSTLVLHSQSWRWQGRPLLDLPWTHELSARGWPRSAQEVRDADEEYLGWEAAAFADLDDLVDTVRVPVAYPPSLEKEVLYRESFGDPRSMLQRWSVEVRSRYGPLFPNRRLSVRAAQNSPTLPGLGWRRCLLPYRGPQLSRPVVRAWVPLTRGLPESGDRAAPLLVVLDEPYFEQAGIVESLEAEVEQVTSYRVQKQDDGQVVGQPQEEQIFQIGPDSGLDAGTYLDRGRPEIEVTGPFGYTFDTDARQPKFRHAAFILRPPSWLQDSVETVLDGWAEAKIRLRRATWVGSGEGRPPRRLASDWTQGQWVQFLPSSDFGVSNSEGPRLVVGPDKDGARPLSLVLSETSDVARYREVDSATGEVVARYFFFYALVTSTITDFAGKPDEVYRATLALEVSASDGGEVCLAAEVPSAIVESVGMDRLRIRLVEVQVIPSLAHERLVDDVDAIQQPEPRRYAPAENAEQLWRELLDHGAGDGIDSLARLTRMSRPWIPRTEDA